MKTWGSSWGTSWGTSWGSRVKQDSWGDSWGDSWSDAWGHTGSTPPTAPASQGGGYWLHVGGKPIKKRDKKRDDEEFLLDLW